MANLKLSELSNLAAVPANDDEVYVRDVSEAAGSAQQKALELGYIRRFKVDSVIATGSITPNAMQFITLNLGTAIGLTISGAPSAGDVLVIYRKGSGAVTHTVTLSGAVKWNAANNTIASFDTDAEVLIAIAESATLWTVVYQSGVAFS